jgi:type I restriction enzyme S subunit
MSFPCYEEYQDSSFDWLGEIPKKWSLGKFRHLFSESSEKIESEVYGEMLSVSGYRGIEIKEYSDENQKRTDENLIGYRIVHAEQLVVNTMWLNYAGLGISQLEGHVSPAYRSYWVDPSLHTRYVHHLMRSSLYVLGYTKYLTGVRPNSLPMGREDLMSVPIVIPSYLEQKIIADFLDKETKKIDTLIAEQEKLIELLKEKRQGIILNSVTKGLNANVSLKDSGVQWIGKVPEHWKIDRLKISVSSCKNGIWGDDPQGDNNDIPCVRVADFDRRKLRVVLDEPTIRNVTEKERLTRILHKGDLLLEKSGGGENQPVGTVVLYEEDQPAVCSNFVAKVVVNNNINSSYMRYVHFAIYSLRITTKSINQTSGIQNLDQDKYFNEKAPFPPKSEQDLISGFLDEETSRFDNLTSEAELVIELLKERRSALISAAVTGQIDVRNYQPEETA